MRIAHLSEAMRFANGFGCDYITDYDIIIAGCEIEREIMVANDKKVNKIPNA